MLNALFDKSNKYTFLYFMSAAVCDLLHVYSNKQYQFHHKNMQAHSCLEKRTHLRTHHFQKKKKKVEERDYLKENEFTI